MVGDIFRSLFCISGSWDCVFECVVRLGRRNMKIQLAFIYLANTDQKYASLTLEIQVWTSSSFVRIHWYGSPLGIVRECLYQGRAQNTANVVAYQTNTFVGRLCLTCAPPQNTAKPDKTPKNTKRTCPAPKDKKKAGTLLVAHSLQCIRLEGLSPAILAGWLTLRPDVRPMPLSPARLKPKFRAL